MNQTTAGIEASPHSQGGQTIVGIDVGAEEKGFHAVALCGGHLMHKKTDRDPAAIVDWCLQHKARVVAVDAPCGWSQSGAGKSRLAERQLFEKKVHCFWTPTRDCALDRPFCKWMFNGERLYRCLKAHYPLFDGQRTEGQICIETFPQAVACALAGRVVSARHKKAAERRTVLKERGYDTRDLRNIDFVDAALCAVAGDEFRRNRHLSFGCRAEGFIVVPDPASRE